MTLDKHNCTKEEFYVLAKTKTEPVLDNVPEGEIYPPENSISTDIPPDPTKLVEMEVGEVLASTITETLAPLTQEDMGPGKLVTVHYEEVKQYFAPAPKEEVPPEPKKSWKKVKAAK